MSLFGVEARPPTPLDLEGLLAGAGQVTRMGGTARVSIVVGEPWRAAALQAECALRGLAATVEAAPAEEPPGVPDRVRDGAGAPRGALAARRGEATAGATSPSTGDGCGCG